MGGETVKIPVDTIYSVEAKGHYIRLHTSVGDYEYKKNLSEIAEELAKDQPSGRARPSPTGPSAAGCTSTTPSSTRCSEEF